VSTVNGLRAGLGAMAVGLRNSIGSLVSMMVLERRRDERTKSS
jgi:hypothetical protein